MNYYGETKLNLDLIEDDFLKKITLAFLKEKVPKYFFKIPASSTGKYHPSFDAGEQGTIRHTNVGLEVAKELLRLNEFKKVNHYSAYVAIVLHDAFKNGYDDSGHTVLAHPEIASIEFKNFAMDYIDDNYEEYEKYSSSFEIPNYRSLINEIAYAIKTHMGDWGNEAPETPLERLVFLSDYIASRKFFDLYFSSTPENLEKAFRIQERKYHIEDAIAHCREKHPEVGFSDEEYNLLAEKFEDKHDCNIADNDLWDVIINDYMKDRR